MDGSWYSKLRNLFVVTVVSMATTGCTTVQPQPWSLFGSSAKETSPAEIATAPQATFVIEMLAANGKPKEAVRPLTANLHVQEALTAVNGFKRFSRFDIELHRQTPQGGMHRMVIEYASATRRVEPEYDYVIHPGDRIVVTEVPETIFDDAVNAVLSPLGLERLKPSKKPVREMPARFRMEG